MEITTELIDYLSTLARLRLDGEEQEKMKLELQQIIGYMDVLNGLDTTGVEPMSHIFPLKNVFREDVVEPSTDRAALLANSPCPDEEAFLVPKAVE
jgi:aspartyl-tRNA(Asn)/glutamyl-tRNA(Gln) amidotransferase subunit C